MFAVIFRLSMCVLLLRWYVYVRSYEPRYPTYINAWLNESSILRMSQHNEHIQGKRRFETSFEKQAYKIVS